MHFLIYRLIEKVINFSSISLIFTFPCPFSGVFVFRDILDNPKVKAIDNADHANLIALLKLFCFGDYDVYKSSVSKYPELTPLQQRKLRQLTIISACSSHRQILYTTLLAKLDISSLRELEDLIIELFYVEAICGRLDQQRGLLISESSISRDLLPSDVISPLSKNI